MNTSTARRAGGAATLALVLVFAGVVSARSGDPPVEGEAWSIAYESIDETLTPMRALIERYAADRQNLTRFYDAPMSRRRAERQQQFLRAWKYSLEKVDFDALDQDSRVDYLLLRNELRSRLGALEIEHEKHEQIRSLIPFAQTIVELQEKRRWLEPVDPKQAAIGISALAEAVDETQKQVESALEKNDPDDDQAEDSQQAPETGEEDEAVEENETQAVEYDKSLGNRAAAMLERLRRTLESWYRFYDGYDPLFTWWVAEPFEKADEQLKDYAGFIKKRIVGIKDDDDDDIIIGDPIGREELLTRLRLEMIPYTPEELLAIAQREMAWCRQEMLRASNDLGYGDDWQAALDHVKKLHVEPGEQPGIIRDLAREAVEFLEARDLVTIPKLCKETWRMEMMSPKRQKTSPYFLGGEVIMVSFPTRDMAHEDKLMSMRGNNVHFARATVHHELIPGHHLQGFMTRRHRTHRRVFSTPFWGEGWPLYWEMLLWDLDFPQSPENRIGMLFWRTHRCARIIFSLKFHLEQMTAEDAIEFLIENVGHERNNATAEVRRSVRGGYGPLYQAAYMLGGLQIRALHRELVESGRMSDREFHDAVLRQNSIPIELIRAALTMQPLTSDYEPSWRFYGDVEVPPEDDGASPDAAP